MGDNMRNGIYPEMCYGCGKEYYNSCGARPEFSFLNRKLSKLLNLLGPVMAVKQQTYTGFEFEFSQKPHLWFRFLVGGRGIQLGRGAIFTSCPVGATTSSFSSCFSIKKNTSLPRGRRAYVSSAKWHFGYYRTDQFNQREVKLQTLAL